MWLNEIEISREWRHDSCYTSHESCCTDGTKPRIQGSCKQREDSRKGGSHRTIRSHRRSSNRPISCDEIRERWRIYKINPTAKWDRSQNWNDPRYGGVSCESQPEQTYLAIRNYDPSYRYITYRQIHRCLLLVPYKVVLLGVGSPRSFVKLLYKIC